MMRFTANQNLVIAGWNNGDSANQVHMHIWRKVGKPRGYFLLKPGSRLTSIDILPDGKRIAVGNVDGTLRMIKIEPHEEQHSWLAHRNHEAWTLAQYQSNRLLSGGDDGRVRIWDTASRRPLVDFLAHSKNGPELVIAARYSPSGNAFATCGFDGNVKIWDAGNPQGNPLQTLRHEKKIRAIAYSPSGKQIATGCEDKIIRIFSTETGRLIQNFEMQEEKIRALEFLDENRLISLSNNGILSWWNPQHSKREQVCVQASMASCMAISPDGKTLATGTIDGSVVLRNAETGEIICRNAGHASRIISIAYSRDGLTLATGSRHGEVRLWKASNANDLYSLMTDGPQINQVLFSTDGSTLYACRHDSMIYSWSSAMD